MADDTNIDEILKSIDALLKEGGLEKDSIAGAGEQGANTPLDIATNDDEVPGSEIPEASVPMENESDQTDEPAMEATDQAVEAHSGADEAETDEQQPDEDRQAEAAQVEDVQAELASEVDTPPGQTFEQKHETKRIVLSESMVVEDSPQNFAVAGNETAIEEDQPEDSMDGEAFSHDSQDLAHGAADDFSEDEVEDSGESPESEGAAITEAPEREEGDAIPVDASEPDMHDLVEQITSEISVRLQQQLPGMVAGMVAEAMQKNLVAQANIDNESTDDTQN